MITVLKHGVTIHDNAEGALVQSAKVTQKKEKDVVLGMLGGKTQARKIFEHTDTFNFSVTGKGDLTLSPGAGADAKLSLISGGVTFIDEVSLEEKLSGSSEWSYSGDNYPHAAA